MRRGAPPSRPHSAVSETRPEDGKQNEMAMLMESMRRPSSGSLCRSNMTLARCVSRQLVKSRRNSPASRVASRPQSALSTHITGAAVACSVAAWSADGRYFGTGDRRVMKVANFDTMSPRGPGKEAAGCPTSEDSAVSWSAVANSDGRQVHATGDRHVKGVSLQKCLPRPPPKIDRRAELHDVAAYAAVSSRTPCVRFDAYSSRTQDAFRSGQGPPPTVVHTASVVSAAVSKGRATVRNAAEEEYEGEMLVDEADRRYVLGDKEESRVRARKAVRQQHRYRPYILGQYKDPSSTGNPKGYVTFKLQAANHPHRRPPAPPHPVTTGAESRRGATFSELHSQATRQSNIGSWEPTVPLDDYGVIRPQSTAQAPRSAPAHYRSPPHEPRVPNAANFARASPRRSILPTQAPVRYAATLRYPDKHRPTLEMDKMIPRL